MHKSNNTNHSSKPETYWPNAALPKQIVIDNGPSIYAFPLSIDMDTGQITMPTHKNTQVEVQ